MRKLLVAGLMTISLALATLSSFAISGLKPCMFQPAWANLNSAFATSNTTQPSNSSGTVYLKRPNVLLTTPHLPLIYGAMTDHVANRTRLVYEAPGASLAPDYVGYLDWANCNTIWGWAADRNRLNQSINVRIYDGATLLTTVLANVARDDVGRALSDNGLHGFLITTPNNLKDGQTHSISAKFESSETSLSTSPQTSIAHSSMSAI